VFNITGDPPVSNFSYLEGSHHDHINFEDEFSASNGEQQAANWASHCKFAVRGTFKWLQKMISSIYVAILRYGTSKKALFLREV